MVTRRVTKVYTCGTNKQRDTYWKGRKKYLDKLPAFAIIQTTIFAGEVASLSPETNELNVQYYDYETDALKEISFTLDNVTELENVKALDEIAVGDTVNVEYVKEAAKNIARRITVEKTEFQNTPSSQDKPETP